MKDLVVSQVSLDAMGQRYKMFGYHVYVSKISIYIDFIEFEQ